MQNRVFTFKSGYTVGIRTNYSPRLHDLALQTWQEQNPPPEPPVELKPVRNGMIEVKRTHDPEYQDAVRLWSYQKETFSYKAKLSMAIDPASLDQEVLAAARAYYAENNLPIPDSDTMLYLGVVADRGSGELKPEIAAINLAVWWAKEFKSDNEGVDLIPPDVVAKLEAIVKDNSGEPGQADFQEDEFLLLGRFIDKQSGPSSALVEHLMKATFRNGDVAQAEHLDVQPEKQRRKAKSA